MSFWLNKSTGIERDYIVLKHTVPGVNYIIHGIKFRDSYAVVERDSKVHKQLKLMPMLKQAKELPLIYLRKLSFITKAMDVLTVFGKDVYSHYLVVLDETIAQEKQDRIVQQQEEHVSEGGCTFVLDKTNRYCGKESLECSPSQYCTYHLLEDPILPELGLISKKFMTKQEKKDWRDKVVKFLEKNSKKIEHKKAN